PAPCPAVGASPAPSLPATSEIAARGAAEAPLMREAQRFDALAGPEARSAPFVADRDACVRVLFEASSDALAFLESESAGPLGAPSRGTRGAVPPQGPACVKQGTRVRLVVRGAAQARAVLFTAP
ncbi:MAG: hypothetical protein JWP97_1108, partial [Labilithrix sp.]|nr:hypothetical protein [Labilithrix sp.]